MISPYREKFLEIFKEDCMGKYEEYDVEKLRSYDFSEITHPHWRDESNKDRVGVFETFIIDKANYSVKDGYLVVCTPDGVTKLDLSSPDLEFGITRVPLSYGTHYSIDAGNGKVSCRLGYYPPFRKAHAEKRASEFIEDITSFLKKENLL